MFSSLTTTTTSIFLLLSLPSLLLARHPASSNSPRSATSEEQHRERPAHIYQDPNDHISALNLNFLPFLKKAASLYTSNPNPSSHANSGSSEKKTGRRSSTEKKRNDRKIEMSKEEGRMLLQSGLMESVNVKGRGEGGRDVVGRSRGGL